VIAVLLALVVLAVLRGLALRGHNLKGSAEAPGGRSEITSWLSDAAPAAWDRADNRIVVNRRGSSGLWNAFTIAPDGSDERCLTCTAPAFAGVGVATNRAASDVSPNGRYALLVVEKGAHPGAIGAGPTQPGKGVYNDIWLATIDGSRAWQLTDIPVSSQVGIIWPRFDRTGREIVWSQMYSGSSLSHPLGEWALKLARLAWSHGTPRLVDVRTYDPQLGRFFEPYEFSPDDRRILFASDIDVPSHFLAPSAFNAQIWTINAARLDDLRRVSPRGQIGGMFSDYNEFAYYIPGSDRILFARTYHSSAHGLDYWTVNANGSDPLRLTFMNQPGNAQYLGYSQAGGLAFDPRDPRRLVAGVAHDLSSDQIQAVFVRIGSGLG
jgi:hypothetical protein